MTSALEAIMSKLKDVTDEERQKFEEQINIATAAMTWFPNEGPQTEAYFSEADILLYGGQAGGGKTDLMMGCATQRHLQSIIFRREGSQTDGLEKTGKRIIGESASYNGSDKEWTWEDGKTLKLAGLKEPDDWMKYAGRERDLIGYDEAGEFLEKQVRSMVAWLRAPEGQRCRMILASNPPRTAEGLWLLKWFAPWLDNKFSNPSLPGELRYCIFVGDDIKWVEGPGESTVNGEQYTHFSLTFIPASLEDNPFRNTPEYRAKLQSLPEPLRSQLLYGDFGAGIKDGEKQVIPTDWIIAAQNRWTPRPPEGMAMTAMAKDPAGGGEDAEEMIERYGGWFSEITTYRGAMTADGSESAARIVVKRRDNCPVIVDVGGGYGGTVCMRLRDNGLDEDEMNKKVIPFNGANKSLAKTKDGQLGFANKRSEGYWKLREELDPNQEGGSTMALPPDPELRADLAAPTWELTSRGIQVESKAVYKEGKLIGGIKKRLGRSPGKGDVVMMCLSEGNAAVRRAVMTGGNRPKVIQGYSERKRQR